MTRKKSVSCTIFEIIAVFLTIFAYGGGVVDVKAKSPEEQVHALHQKRRGEIEKEREALQKLLQTFKAPPLKQTVNPQPCKAAALLKREDVALPQEPPVRVFMSFSVPTAMWGQLSQELEKVHGVFVVQGLPGCSFQAFAAEALALRKAGVKAPIVVDPPLFLKHNIKSVPCFQLMGTKAIYWLRGAVSLSYAIDKANEHTKDPGLKALSRHLKGNKP